LGEMALLTGEPRVASALAVTPVTALRITRDAFDQLASEQKELREGIWRAFGSHRLDNFLRADSGFSTLDSEVRRAWAEKGKAICIAAGGAQTIGLGDEFAFVVNGVAEYEGQEHHAPSLLRVKLGERLTAREETRIIVLGPAM